jgi:hypothetical protein
MAKVTKIVFAACDKVYYEKYGNFFKDSLNKLDIPYKIHIIDKENDWGCDDRVFYASQRFMMLPEMIEEHGGVLVSDIDVIYLKKFDFPTTKLGYAKTNPKPWRTPWEQRGQHVLAGNFYCSDVDIAKKIRDRILELPKKWFVDQIAIWEVIKDETDVTAFRIPPSLESKMQEGDYLVAPRGIEAKEQFNEKLKKYM